MKCISTPRSILKSIIGAIYASDFYGRNYKINIESGKVEKFYIVK